MLQLNKIKWQYVQQTQIIPGLNTHSSYVLFLIDFTVMTHNYYVFLISSSLLV